AFLTNLSPVRHAYDVIGDFYDRWLPSWLANLVRTRPWALGFGRVFWLALSVLGLISWLLLPPVLKAYAQSRFSDEIQGRAALQWLGRVARCALSVPLLAGALAAIYLYAVVIYPQVPQELGGPRPRCAYVDIAADQVAPETLAAVADSGTPAGTQFVRSIRLDVYFAIGDVFAVRPRATANGQAPIVQLDRGSIKTVTWC
ncbi:MAG: hypothetical protein HY682_09115, partial [Chloroflexi bacterium]|nr:hypothetical protein [Chloroflexota bacterium]